MSNLFKKKDKQNVVREIKHTASKKKSSSLILSILALVLTIIVFAGLLFLQGLFKEDIVYKNIVCAKTDVPEGAIITKNNASDYFEMKNMNTLDIPEKSLTNLTPIEGSRTKVAFVKGEVVSEKDFDSSNVDLSKFKNPVEISIALGDAASSNGGKIRAGDIVNLTMTYSRKQLGMSEVGETTHTSTPVVESSVQVDGNIATDKTTAETTEETTEKVEKDIAKDISTDTSETTSTETIDTSMTETTTQTQVPVETKVINVNETKMLTDDNFDSSSKDYAYDMYGEYVLQNVTVEKALDSKGVEIKAGDTETSASILMFIIDKDEEVPINNALANCSGIRVSKVYTKAAQEKDMEEDSAPVTTTETSASTSTPVTSSSSTQSAVTETETTTKNTQ